MASVAETKAALSAVSVELAQVVQALFGIEGDLSRALEIMNVVRETSVDPIGAPEISAAIAKIEEASTLLRKSIDDNMQYRAGM